MSHVSESHTIGQAPDHWVFVPPGSAPTPSTDKLSTFDLTRRLLVEPYTSPSPSETLSLITCPLAAPATQSCLQLDPKLSALVIIDMQNFFLSPALGRDASGPGHAAMKVLMETIPKCREAGIRIIWCNWGLTEEDIKQMPPAILKGFGGLNAFKHDEERSTTSNIEGEKLVDTKPSRIYRGFGTPMGTVTLPTGEEMDAGRLLMVDQWNSSLPPPLLDIYRSGVRMPHNPDVWVHKNRMSGLWNTQTPLYDVLRRAGIRTLLFAGVNTDQCVQGTLVDAYNSGWDCLLLKDACGTGTPGGKDVTEWNAGRSWGFLLDSSSLVEGISAMMGARART